MTIFDIDFAMLGNLTFYGPYRDVVQIVYASGLVEWLYCVRVEVQLVRESGDPWSPSFLEWAVIRQSGPGLPRLTGVEFRRNFIIGTEPSFDHLSITSSKGGTSSLLQ
jgi:hypothetical protein